MQQSSSIVSAYAPPFKIIAKYFIAAIIDFVILNFLLMINYKDIHDLILITYWTMVISTALRFIFQVLLSFIYLK